MKKIALLICVFTMVFLLAACGDKAVRDDQILNDVEALEVFSNLGVEINDFSIVKRQTSPEDKTDYVYVHVEAANKDISIVRNYMLTYILYNDGWLFEEFESFDNPDSPNETTPLHGVSYEQLYYDLNALSPEAYGSKAENLRICGSESGSSSWLTSGDYLPIDENGVCVYLTEMHYDYPTYYEIATVPLTYHFGGGDYSPDGYTWYLSIDDFDIKRTFELHEGILGYWSGGADWSVEGYLDVTSYNSSTCEATFYAAYYTDTAITGVLEIVPHYSDDGICDRVCLEWVIPQPDQYEDEIWHHAKIYLDPKFTNNKPNSIVVTSSPSTPYYSGFWVKS